jgi:hypothetical protein
MGRSAKKETTEKVDDVLNGLVDRYRDGLLSTLDLTESPVERLLLAELLANGWEGEQCCSDPHSEMMARIIARQKKHPDPSMWKIARIGEAFRGRRRVVPRDPYAHSILLHNYGEQGGMCHMLLVQPMVEIRGKKYRPDFALLPMGTTWHKLGAVAIEVDGHDFHERTKEQAIRDKSRDRAFQAAGWRVLRFTGSEVYGAPEEMAQQINDMVDGTTLDIEIDANA